MGARAVLVGDRRRPLGPVAARVTRDACPPVQHLNDAGGRADLNRLADEGVGNAVVPVVVGDAVVDVDLGVFPVGELVATHRQRIASLSSARLKNVRLRSAAMIQRWAMSTPPSTLALSLGLRGRAGMTVTP
jgi:hypothetical protein